MGSRPFLFVMTYLRIHQSRSIRTITSPMSTGITPLCVGLLHDRHRHPLCGVVATVLDDTTIGM